MGTKNLAIREDIYRKLAEAKRKNESFSDVIERLLGRRRSLLSLRGALAESKSMLEIESDIRKIRKGAVIRTR
jgi:predicted CopG family antitoxin